ncbi:7-alpha-hydroxysteroid dehydrogenase [Aspergillus saccharolyticus JOP 1030-1]|uniref:7-alpha-hydroxysteroid dehydrogenase n=1 Tax=Aspergillus saccharolyticus JOP 1030-1 TaxID=1450539 RepID=A0A318ZJT2_9EURO|nr:7-alpha-hydroxysteroid dehydrogenase [Aspergillus saccharolyticus JOP 1030-1]PYH47107.1 7-alpha-hydroxysteroid dehydrogenase [Aspergillus saccharolyticus JOP 1030-1]
MASKLTKSIAIIAGAGPGTGASIARRFAQTYPVVLLARRASSLDPLVEQITQAGGTAIGIPADVTQPGAMESTMQQLERQYGRDHFTVAAAVFNVASKFSRSAFLDSGEEFLASLEATARGASNFSKAVLPFLLRAVEEGPQGQLPPTLVFTGATASLKGGSGLGSFAMSKFAVRALAQSLAREFGPKGVHVAHAIIDGIIATEQTKEYLADKPDAKIDPDWIAEAYWFLHSQPRSSFTHELDLRPYCETW